MRDAVFVGIDVSKGTLDVGLRPSGESFRVGNDQGGISALVERLSGVQPELVVLEASGGYETAVVAELAAASIAVTVVNPRQVRDFARAIGQLGKSDVLDARILALFAERVRPEVRPLGMEWLSMGPYGNRSGDILLLTRSGLNRPIQDRYYFSGPYHSWHGSASPQDSHIPLIVARQNYPSAKLKKMVDKVAGEQPSQLALVPLVLELLVSEPPSAPAVPPTKPGSDQAATPATKSQ